MSKKKLLITLGDSFTEGVGCWDYKLFSTEMITLINDWTIDRGYILYSNSKHFDNVKKSDHKNNFHLRGWPNKLGKKLKFDMVVNMGNSGDSNSAQSKKFYNKYINNELNDWDVSVVWLLTFPDRFSFYTGDGITSYQSADTSPNRLSEYYYKELINLSIHTKYESDIFIELSTNRESVYHINTVETLCKLKGYKLYLFTYDDNVFNSLKNEYTGKSLINNASENPIKPPFGFNDFNSKLCGHFNEDGYEHIAENMKKSLLSMNLELGNNYSNDLKWEWVGQETPYK